MSAAKTRCQGLMEVPVDSKEPGKINLLICRKPQITRGSGSPLWIESRPLEAKCFKMRMPLDRLGEGLGQRMRLRGERSTAGGLGQVGCLRHGIVRAESWNPRKIVPYWSREALRRRLLLLGRRVSVWEYNLCPKLIRSCLTLR
jgi:hypothetical protein